MTTEILSQAYPVAWLPWAVTYFFFIGISYGAVLLTLPAVLLGRKQQDGVARLAILVMMVSVLAGLAGLLGDLHQPGRFWHFYAYFSPYSWMSIGAIILPVYLLSIFVYGLLYLRIQLLNQTQLDEPPSWVARLLLTGSTRFNRPALLKWMAVLTTLLAALIILYTGAEVMIVKARPLWNSWFLLVFYFSSALSGAIAASLLLGLFININRNTQQRLAQWLRWSLLLYLLISVLWIGSAYLGTSSVSQILGQILNTEFKTSVLTVLLLAVLAWLVAFGSGAMLWLATLLALGVTWMSRWLIFMDGQRLPKYGSGFYPYQLPTDGEGLMGIIGIFGLALFLVIVLYHYLPWQFAAKTVIEHSASDNTGSIQ